MLTTMFKDCYLQTNVMLKMREECGKIKEPGSVLFITSYLFDVLRKQYKGQWTVGGRTVKCAVNA